MYSFMVLSERCQMKIYMCISKRHKCMGNGSAKLFFARMLLSLHSNIPHLWQVSAF